MHKLVWRNLIAHPLRSILTVLAITLGVGMVLAAAIVGQAAGRSAAQISEQSHMGNVVLVQAVLAMAGLIILLTAGFVILNAFAMAVTGRLQELAALRALGTTRRQVLGLVLAEAGLLGLIGTGLGLPAGLGLARGVMQAMGSLEEVALVVPGWGLALAPLLGLGVTLGAALPPAARAGRVSPIAAARPAAATPGWYERSGGQVGAALLILTLLGQTAYSLLVRPNALQAQAIVLLGQAGLLGAMVLLLPALVGPLARTLRPPLSRWLGVPGRLATDNLERNRLRAALTVGALAAGLTMLVALSGLSTAALKGTMRSLGFMVNEDTFVAPDIAAMVASNEFAVENFLQTIAQPTDETLNPVLAALDPLARAGLIEVERCRFAAIPPELATIPGAPGIFVDMEVFLAIGNFTFFQGDPEQVLAWMQQGGIVLIQPIVAERMNVGVGDKITVQTTQGEVAFTVAGIGGSGYMMTVFSYADGERYFDINTPSHIGIVVREGSIEETLEQVRAALASFPQVTLNIYENSFDPLMGMIEQLQQLINALLLLSVVVAALGVVNTMVINVSERRREMDLLRAVGATQGQVRRIMVVEAALLGLLAALVAAGLGLLMLLSWGLLVLPHGTAALGVRPDGDMIRLTMGAGLRDWGLAALGGLVLGPLVAGLAANLALINSNYSPQRPQRPQRKPFVVIER